MTTELPEENRHLTTSHWQLAYMLMPQVGFQHTGKVERQRTVELPCPDAADGYAVEMDGIASGLSPLPGFESHPGHVRKLPVTCG